MSAAKYLIGALGSLLLLNLMLGGLWLDAREKAQEAAQEAREAEVALEASQDAARRTRALLAAERALLVERDRQQTHHATQLAEARRDLDLIRARAREETTDASLTCAVRAVPGDVDQLLRGPAAAD